MGSPGVLPDLVFVCSERSGMCLVRLWLGSLEDAGSFYCTFTKQGMCWLAALEQICCCSAADFAAFALL